MAKGKLHTVDNLETETLMASLKHTPRCTVDLVDVSEPSSTSRHFILRKVKFFAPNNIKGYEIKITESEAHILADALRLTLGPSPQLSKSTEAVG